MRNPIWLRGFFALVVLQALMLGLALIWPDLIALTLPWPATPLNARFVAALYCMGVVTGVLSVFAATYAAVRVSLVSVGAITGGLLLLTLPHLGEFGPAGFPGRWLIFYTVDVVIVALALYRLRGRDVRPAGRHRMAPLVLGYSTLLAVLGAVMLTAPEFAVQVWPWSLTAILAQVYSVFLLTFAVGGVLVARDPRWETGWIWTTANLCTVLLVIGLSVANFGLFRPGPSTWIWFGVLAIATLALSASLLYARSARAPVAVTTQEATT